MATHGRSRPAMPPCPDFSDADSGGPPLEFTESDLQHLRAAQGWIELGLWDVANDELEQITPELRAHPDVLKSVSLSA